MRFQKPLRVLTLCATSALTVQCSAVGTALAQNTPGRQSTLTLHAESRLVIEDILVTDAKGNAVHGLPASAFHVSDNGKSQEVRSLDENNGPTPNDDSDARQLPAGTFSNATYLGSPKALSEVFLVDADDIETTTQMFLLSELKHAIAKMPAGMQAGLFCVRQGRPVQVRGMTKSREDLIRALGECVPTIEHTGVDSFSSGVNQILTVASFLQPIPGRKNVLWFAGPFPLVPITSQEEQAGGISVNSGDRVRLIHQLQETLSEARVAIYPVDPRGVLTVGLADPGAPVNQTTNRSMGMASGVRGEDGVPFPAGASDMDRIDYMEELARATGGKAYILNNLKEEVGQALDLGSSAYTLSYSPRDYVNDASWHTVAIQVDGPYTLSYRRGYLAVWNGDVRSVAGQFLQADGGHPMPALDLDVSKPLLFEVKTDEALTSDAKKPSGQLAFDFSIMPDQLGFVSDAGKWRDELVIASYAYDERGNLKGGEQQELDAAFTPDQWEQAQARHITAHQSFAVPKSAKYVLFVVRDKRSRRQGTLMLPTRALTGAK